MKQLASLYVSVMGHFIVIVANLLLESRFFDQYTQKASLNGNGHQHFVFLWCVKWRDFGEYSSSFCAMCVRTLESQVVVDAIRCQILMTVTARRAFFNWELVSTELCFKDRACHKVSWASID